MPAHIPQRVPAQDLQLGETIRMSAVQEGSYRRYRGTKAELLSAQRAGQSETETIGIRYNGWVMRYLVIVNVEHRAAICNTFWEF